MPAAFILVGFCLPIAVPSIARAICELLAEQQRIQRESDLALMRWDDDGGPSHD